MKKGANMFEPKTKAITRWGLTIRGTDVFFPKKETTIKIGRLTLKMNPETRMFEEYRLHCSCLGNKTFKEDSFLHN